MIGRQKADEVREPTDAEVELAALQTRVDQAVAIVNAAQRCNRMNRQLVDVCLDVRNALLGPPGGR